MNKWLNKILLGSCIVLLAGIAFVFIGKVFGGNISWYYNRDKNSILSESSSYIEESNTLDPFDEIYVSNKSLHVDIVVSDEYSYSYKGSSEYAPNVSMKDKTLYISVPNTWKNIQLLEYHENLITITVPDDKDYMVKIDQTSGLTTISNVNIHGNISSSSGEVEITNSHSSKDLNILIKSGSSTLTDLSANNLTIDKTSGNSEINNTTVEKLVLSSSSGMTSISNLTSPVIIAKTSSGSMSAERITTDDLTLKSSSGNVDLSIVGKSKDYSCSLSKSSGSMNYDGYSIDDKYRSDNSASKSIIASVTSGCIDIEFVE